MSTYVDDVRHSFGRMVMCHLWADTLPELLNMVDVIGVQRKWIQGHKQLSFGKHKDASWVHFDISIGKKYLAIQNGAILTDKYGPVLHTRRLRLWDAIARADLEAITRHQAFIDQIENMRKKEY